MHHAGFMAHEMGRLRRQTGSTEGDCTACGTRGELTVWESWTPVKRWLNVGKRDIRHSLRCGACGYRMPLSEKAGTA